MSARRPPDGPRNAAEPWWHAQHPGAAARAYYERVGWSVIPASRDGKRARVRWKGWQQTAPRTDVLTTWWRTWPRANPAVVTGRVSGIVVLDVDPRAGGDESLHRLERDRGDVPWTCVVETPSGGWHSYMAHPGGRIPNSAGTLGPGLDIRGDGGIALLPPSRRSAGAYRWALGGPDAIPPLPRWLLELLRPPPPPPRPTVPPPSVNGGGYWRSALRGELERLKATIPGQCHFALTRSAYRMGQLAHLGMPEDDVIEALADAALTNAREPKSRLAALKTAAECFQAGKDKPR
jgi:hypothetical protein